jgi:hypothetical protein
MKGGSPGGYQGSDGTSTESTAANGQSKRSARTFLDKWRDAVRCASADVVGDEYALDSTERAVALELSRYMNWTSGQRAYPGPARIAKNTAFHVVTVKKTLASLERKQWTVVTKRGELPRPGQKRRANVYAASLPPTLISSPALPVPDAKPVDDETTSSSEFHDWESCARPLVAHGYPISNEHLIDLPAENFEIEALACSIRLNDQLAS